MYTDRNGAFDGLTPALAANAAPDALAPLAASAPFGSNTATVVAYPYTHDYRVDTLVDSDPNDFPNIDYRWNDGQPLGTNITVTYSFMNSVPWYGGNVDVGSSGFMAFTQAEKAATRTIMSHLSAELGINLVEVGDSQSSYGQIRLGNNTQDSTAGYTWLPFSAGDDKSGDVWIDNTPVYQGQPNFLNQVTLGTDLYDTLTHEIGHSLGLKHPGNYNAGSAVGQEPGNYLGSAEDNYNYSIMSYNYAPQASNSLREWYGMYDLLALKTLYGANPGYNAGNSTYAYTDTAGANLEIIDDASGTDTLDLHALTLGATVDLHPGGFSSIGRNGFAAAVNNLSIDLTTHIENFIGTLYNDRISLNTGSSVADGSGGIDTVVYAGSRGAYQVTPTSANMEHVTGGGMDDTLANVERFEFTDGKFAFDLGGNAGETAKILGAVFDQGAHPQPVYVGVGLGYLDSGMGYDTLMQGSINYVLGAGHTHAQMVNLIYTNVAGVAPTPDVLQYWVSQLDAGAFSEASLATAAADTSYNSDRIDLTGLAQHGLQYA